MLDIEESDDEAEEPQAVKNNFTAHSYRRTGAREWCREGLTEQQLKALGRWTSAAWEKYVSSLPAACFTTGGEQPQKAAMAVHRAMHDVLKELTKGSAELGSLRQATEKEVATTATPAEMPPLFVLTSQSEDGKLHRVTTLLGHRLQWRTSCGFKFGASKSDFEILDKSEGVAAAKRCKDCFDECSGRKGKRPHH